MLYQPKCSGTERLSIMTALLRWEMGMFQRRIDHHFHLLQKKPSTSGLTDAGFSLLITKRQLQHLVGLRGTRLQQIYFGTKAQELFSLWPSWLYTNLLYWADWSPSYILDSLTSGLSPAHTSPHHAPQMHLVITFCSTLQSRWDNI